MPGTAQPAVPVQAALSTDSATTFWASAGPAGPAMPVQHLSQVMLAPPGTHLALPPLAPGSCSAAAAAAAASMLAPLQHAAFGAVLPGSHPAVRAGPEAPVLLLVPWSPPALQLPMGPLPWPTQTSVAAPPMAPCSAARAYSAPAPLVPAHPCAAPSPPGPPPLPWPAASPLHPADSGCISSEIDFDLIFGE